MSRTARLCKGAGSLALGSLLLSGVVARAAEPPPLSRQLSELGRQALAQGQTAQARTFFRKALQLDPNNAEASRALSRQGGVVRVALQDPPPVPTGDEAPAPEAETAGDRAARRRARPGPRRRPRPRRRRPTPRPRPRRPPPDAPAPPERTRPPAAEEAVPPPRRPANRPSRAGTDPTPRATPRRPWRPRPSSRTCCGSSSPPTSASASSGPATWSPRGSPRPRSTRSAWPRSVVRSADQVSEGVRTSLDRELQTHILSTIRAEERIVQDRAERLRVQAAAEQQVRALDALERNQDTISALMIQFNSLMAQGQYNVFANGGLGDVTATTAPFFNARNLAMAARALDPAHPAPRAGCSCPRPWASSPRSWPTRRSRNTATC